jgi:hypothetical protein
MRPGDLLVQGFQLHRLVLLHLQVVLLLLVEELLLQGLH